MAQPVSSRARQSRRTFLRFAGQGIASAALLAACSDRAEPLPIPTTPVSAPTAQDESLEAKIGQMLMVGFRGLEAGDDHPIARDIRDRHLGGVVLFDYDVPTQTPVRNIESPAQVKALVASLQAFSSTPLLVAIDQEGGKVSRLKEDVGFPPTVSAQYLGTMNDLALSHEHAAAMAETMAQLGINLNLGRWSISTPIPTTRSSAGSNAASRPIPTS